MAVSRCMICFVQVSNNEPHLVDGLGPRKVPVCTQLLTDALLMAHPLLSTGRLDCWLVACLGRGTARAQYILVVRTLSKPKLDRTGCVSRLGVPMGRKRVQKTNRRL